MLNIFRLLDAIFVLYNAEDEVRAPIRNPNRHVPWTPSFQHINAFKISPTRLSLTSRVVMAAENMCVLFTLVGCVLGNAHGSSQFRRMTFRLQALERIIHFTHREYALQVSAALCMIVEIGVNVLEYFCWSFVFGADSFLEYSAVYVSQLVCGVVLLQFVDFVLRLNNRFTHLNQLLRKNVTYWKVGFRKEDQLMKPFYLVVERGGQSVIRLVEVHTRLCQLIDTLCRVYGVQMFFIASYTVLNLTFCTYYTVICSFHPRYDKVRVAILIPEAALTLLYAPKLILLLWSCTAAERQASLTKAILGECIEPENSDSPYQKQTLVYLADLLTAFLQTFNTYGPED
ncbi:hypothetical protein AAG570_000122 [Ranatra chinensis]|uniref:Gustatory receptor n=1 Tax=Ranatra chinensis TaxID=642074 RepID=A0ABD0YW65_9HEMI